jgi:predicted DNA-binding antitoxin AbrB/MazE fold protein
MENLAIYEQGIPQPLFKFPLKEGKKWTFSLFGISDFEAKVKGIRAADLPDGKTTYIVDIEAISPSGAKLTYSFDTKAQWINSLILENSDDEPQIEMNQVSYGIGFSGNVFFVRGVDIVDDTYVAPELSLQNSLVQGHPDWGPFDSLIYHFEVHTQDSSGGTLNIKDPSSSSEGLKRVFGPNIFESSLGTIPSPSEEVSIQVSLFGNVNLRLRIAGGIEYMWMV